MTRQPVSTWTALAYPLAGAGVLHLSPGIEAAVFALLMLLLGIGTWAFHLRETELSSDLDHAAMIGLLVGLGTLAVGAPWWMALLGAVGFAWALVYRDDLYSHALIGVLLYYVVVALMGRGAWAYLAGGVGAMGAGFWVWQQGTDRAHSFWHVLTAMGLAFLALAVL